MKRTITAIMASLFLAPATMAAEYSLVTDYTSSHGLGGGDTDFTLVWILGGAFIVGRMFRKVRR